jgi:antitoxin MazE
MRTNRVKLISIGNSKGIRLTKAILEKYQFSDVLIMEECENGILLHNQDSEKYSWEKTYREMAGENEDWGDFDNTILDGIDEECQ